MLKEWKGKGKVTGVKQSGRAVRSGRAREVFLANDADPALIEPLRLQCQSAGVPICCQYTMRQLGQAAGIQVGAAVVALLAET